MNKILLLTIPVLLLLVLTACGKKEVKLYSQNEVEQKFEQKESFVLVLGDSYCTSCKQYKDETLTEYVNQYSDELIVLLYSNESFSNPTDFDMFQKKYHINYNVSPSSFYIKEGIVIDRVEDFMTLKELLGFIEKNEASS